MPALLSSTAAVLSLAAVATSIMPRMALSQPSPPPAPVEHRGGLHLGYLQLDLGDLNRALNSAGYPSLDEGFFTIGGGGYEVRDRFVGGGEFHGVLGKQKNTAGGTYTLSATGAFGLLRGGYLVHRSSRLDVFPMLGVGLGTMSLKIAQRNALTFGEVLADPGRSATLTNVSFLLDASVHLDWRFHVRQREPNRDGGVVVGVQGGYALSPWTSRWKLDDLNSVAGGPPIRLRGPYVRVSVGGWNVDLGHAQ